MVAYGKTDTTLHDLENTIFWSSAMKTAAMKTTTIFPVQASEELPKRARIARSLSKWKASYQVQFRGSCKSHSPSSTYINLNWLLVRSKHPMKEPMVYYLRRYSKGALPEILLSSENPQR